MGTNPQPTSVDGRRLTPVDRLVLLLAAVLTLLLTMVSGPADTATAITTTPSAPAAATSNTASGGAGPAAETRVRAPTVGLGSLVGRTDGIAAGRRRDNTLPQPGSASATSVAAESDAAWFQVTKAGANRAGTFVPESFDLSVGGERFSVVPNATKHMAEYATSTGAGSMPMSSLAGAVETAVKQGLASGRNFIQIGPWELGIDTTDNVIYHAVYRP